MHPFFTQIFEAYGQTECSAGCTFSMPGDWTTGIVAETQILPQLPIESGMQA